MYYSSGASLLFMKTCLDMYVYMDMLLETCFWICMYIWICWIGWTLLNYVVGYVGFDEICCWTCCYMLLDMLDMYVCISVCEILSN